MEDIQFMVIDADGWGRVSVLSNDLCFLQANGKPEVLAGIAEASQELLQVLGSMCPISGPEFSFFCCLVHSCQSACRFSP